MGSPTPTPPPPPTPSSRASCYSLRLHRRRAVAGLRRRPHRGKMKLMYFLMDGEGEEQRCRAEELRLEVSELEAVLAKEERLSRVLRCSLQAGRLDAAACRCCLSANLVPSKIRGLLAELAIVEDEIFYLEKKVDDLRTRLLRERNWTHHCILQQQQQQRQRQQDWPPGRHCIGRRELHCGEQLPRLPGPGGGGGGDGGGLERESKASAGPASSQGEETDQSRRSSHSFENLRPPERKICSSSPSKLSEELIKLTVTIFHKLSRTTNHADSELELSSAPKLNITSCIGSSRSLAPKLSSSSSSDRAAPSPIRSSKSRAAAPPECGSDEGEPAGRCERFVEFTRSSFDASRVSLCLADIKNLRVLMNKLCTVDPSFLTNKQKLAFWLNIYNFCVMHAFLQHGLPPSPDKLLALLNQASVNVGGRVLSVLSIERLFLRHPPAEGNRQGTMMEEVGESDMQLCYGLGYPEPNVVFALCRGSRSSPPCRSGCIRRRRCRASWRRPRWSTWSGASAWPERGGRRRSRRPRRGRRRSCCRSCCTGTCGASPTTWSRCWSGSTASSRGPPGRPSSRGPSGNSSTAAGLRRRRRWWRSSLTTPTSDTYCPSSRECIYCRAEYIVLRSTD
ncbi:uncharacterized protein [Aegilops tauschii subsp. strangulata]|nr:uncharacterized protein LOC109756739 isoform X1 [Aegilops tauschii subsp. strangulata]